MEEPHTKRSWDFVTYLRSIIGNEAILSKEDAWFIQEYCEQWEIE